MYIYIYVCMYTYYIYIYVYIICIYIYIYIYIIHVLTAGPFRSTETFKPSKHQRLLTEVASVRAAMSFNYKYISHLQD